MTLFNLRPLSGVTRCRAHHCRPDLTAFMVVEITRLVIQHRRRRKLRAAATLIAKGIVLAVLFVACRFLLV